MHSMNDYGKLDDRAARVGLLFNRGETARAARELTSELPTVAAALALRGFLGERSPDWTPLVINRARAARGGFKELQARAELVAKDLLEGNVEVLAELARMTALDAATFVVLVAEALSTEQRREVFARSVTTVALDDLAQEAADAEQRKRSDPPLDVPSRMSRFAETFPLLFDRPGVRPWDPDALDAWAATSGCTWTERAAAQFVLSVYDQDRAWQCGPFVLHTALQRWDAEQRAAFALWASAPWWP
jgi:hypothetical protein